MGDPDAFGYPLAGPSTPLDTFDLTSYGNWGFWRFLTERYDDETAGVPNLVRQVWEALDTTRRPNALFSLQALDKVLAARRTSTPEQYAAFADANQHPADAYDEAVEQGYPTAPNTLETVQALPQVHPRDDPHHARPPHQRHGRGAALLRQQSLLLVRVDLTDARVARAVVTVNRSGGGTWTTPVPTLRNGKGFVIVPFAASRVSSVEVTLANGSTRMTGCGGGSASACGGSSPDDGLAAEVRFQAVG